MLREIDLLPNRRHYFAVGRFRFRKSIICATSLVKVDLDKFDLFVDTLDRRGSDLYRKNAPCAQIKLALASFLDATDLWRLSGANWLAPTRQTF